MLVALLLLAQLQPLPPTLIPLASDEGQKLLVESTARRAYFPLASQFLTQRSTSFCGVASSVMVLNALPLEAPVAQQWAPFRAFTEDNIFNDETRKTLTPDFVAKGGLTIEQLTFLLSSNHVDAKATHADTSTLEQFRAQASQALAEPDRYVLVDFLRGKLGQDFGAHWSPLGAYNAAADRFLVLDVARFRYPPYWAKAEDLFAAMNTFDQDAGATRGWVVAAKAQGAPARVEIPSFAHKILRYAVAAGSIVFLLGAAAGALLTRWRMRRATSV
ncbi:MAG: phytochelatin synthase family protein [Deltaproteobacteria bacterium]|nr:phytochelatin synthase family protein [Deltaproteobacteria bacterium]